MSQRAQDISLQKRNDREKILAAYSPWRLPFSVPQPERDQDGQFNDVSALPLTHLTPAERQIVQLDATALVQRIVKGQLSAVQVTTAFCKAAVVACDVTNCLTEIMIEDGLKRAAELDEYFHSTGKVVGPLHGLPVSPL
jgi:amidase